MDIILYFLDNPPDVTSLFLLLFVYLVFEVLGEIIAEFGARPIFDKFRPDARIKKVKVWLTTTVGPEFSGENLHVREKKGTLTVLEGRNPLYIAAPGEWKRWERLE